jgi:hypothetical protein
MGIIIDHNSEVVGLNKLLHLKCLEQGLAHITYPDISFMMLIIDCSRWKKLQNFRNNLVGMVFLQMGKLKPTVTRAYLVNVGGVFCKMKSLA